MSAITLVELAKRWKLPRTRIYELAKVGEIPVFRIGVKSLRVPLGWVEQQERDAIARTRTTKEPVR